MIDKADQLFLRGQLLVASPGIGDKRFNRTVIYLCAHSVEGAMGLIVNKPAEDIKFSELLQQLNLLPKSEDIQIPNNIRKMTVLRGGPVETSRGFVLHATDARRDYGSVAVSDDVRLSASIEILQAIAKGEGPDEAVFALGYAGWSAGQLESELGDNGWILCPARHDILFDRDHETKYARALSLIGVDPAMLSSVAGHA